jgi:hypothetical protein
MLWVSGFTTHPQPLPQPAQTQCIELYDLDFELVNETGYDISEVFVSPTKEADWGEDIMGRDILPHGQAVDIVFSTKEREKKWDIYVTWVGYDSDEDVYWTGFDLSKISRITLHYNAKTGETWAETE